jgi:hypothetical protein
MHWGAITPQSPPGCRKTVSKQPALEELWSSASPSDRDFDSPRLSGLSEGARCYLGHAIIVGTPLASAVRLHMHGEIKLKGWCPFSAEQVICWKRGMIWSASVRMHGISIRGGDSLWTDRALCVGSCSGSCLSSMLPGPIALGCGNLPVLVRCRWFPCRGVRFLDGCPPNNVVGHLPTVESAGRHADNEATGDTPMG